MILQEAIFLNVIQHTTSSSKYADAFSAPSIFYKIFEKPINFIHLSLWYQWNLQSEIIWPYPVSQVVQNEYLYFLFHSKDMNIFIQITMIAWYNHLVLFILFNLLNCELLNNFIPSNIIMFNVVSIWNNQQITCGKKIHSIP